MYDRQGAVDYRHHLLNDRWIAEGVFPGVRDGYFVEAGACSGIRGSATYLLETQLGWGGICVEPVDRSYRRLLKTRRCSTDNRCLWDRSGEVIPFTVFSETRPRSGITEVNKNIEGWAGAATQPTQTVLKQTVTLQDLLVEHGAPPIVNYLCLDIEGAERRVLEAFDLRDGRHRILAISIEGGSCDDLMEDAGYVRTSNRFTNRGYDRYFLHPELVSARPELVAA
jgi:FkbM family methyltransferase